MVNSWLAVRSTCLKCCICNFHRPHNTSIVCCVDVSTRRCNEDHSDHYTLCINSKNMVIPHAVDFCIVLQYFVARAFLLLHVEGLIGVVLAFFKEDLFHFLSFHSTIGSTRSHKSTSGVVNCGRCRSQKNLSISLPVNPVESFSNAVAQRSATS
jgi:hypothetical protein